MRVSNRVATTRGDKNSGNRAEIFRIRWKSRLLSSLDAYLESGIERRTEFTKLLRETALEFLLFIGGFAGYLLKGIRNTSSNVNNIIIDSE